MGYKQVRIQELLFIFVSRRKRALQDTYLEHSVLKKAQLFF